MDIYVDCDGTLELKDYSGTKSGLLFPTKTYINEPLVKAILNFLNRLCYSENTVYVWSFSGEQRAKDTGEKALKPALIPFWVVKKDYLTPKKGDIVIDDQPEDWRRYSIELEADGIGGGYQVCTPEQFIEGYAS